MGKDWRKHLYSSFFFFFLSFVNCNIRTIKPTPGHFKDSLVPMCAVCTINPHSHPQLYATSDLLSISVMLGFLKSCFLRNFFPISHLRAQEALMYCGALL